MSNVVLCPRAMLLIVAVGVALTARRTIAEPDTAPPDNPFAAAIAHAQARTVRIYGAGIGREHGYATGVIVSGDGDILTAEGIYLEGGRLRVMTPDGGVYPATVVRRSDAIQSAHIKIDVKTPDFFELDEKPVVEAGDWVVAVSNAFKVADRGEPLSVNLGIVSMRGQLDTKRRMADMDVASDVLIVDAITSNPGAPGGAMVTIDGKLAGMVGKLIQSQETNTWLNYAIPADVLRQFVDGKEIVPEPAIAPASVADGKPFVGLRLFTLSGKRAPAYIDRVLPDSPAAAAGLRKDDLVLAVGEHRVRNVAEAAEAIAALKPGIASPIVVKRGSAIVEATLTPTVEVDDEK